MFICIHIHFIQTYLYAFMLVHMSGYIYTAVLYIDLFNCLNTYEHCIVCSYVFPICIPHVCIGDPIVVHYTDYYNVVRSWIKHWFVQTMKYDLKIFVKYVTDLFLWCSTFDLPLYLYKYLHECICLL